MQLRINYIAILLIALCLFAGCEEEEYSVPSPNTKLENDVIKRTLGPNLVGLNIEFAHAMALPQSAGRLVSARVEATIPGAEGTWMENNSYYYNVDSVKDVGKKIGEPSATTGNITEVSFTADTCAATLRYYYKIPEEARGKSISFIFSATASNGENVSYKMGPYQISEMDVKSNLVASIANPYISIADMAVFDEATAVTNPDKIDLVYSFYKFNVTPALPSAHALGSPVAGADYLKGLTVPAALANNSQLIKVWALRDRHLASLQYGVYIDDIDFKEKDFAGATSSALGLKAESGVWVQTADGKYKAYVYVNKIDDANKTMTISIKRLQMK